LLIQLRLWELKDQQGRRGLEVIKDLEEIKEL
jgi:hypothetical protein